MDVVSLSPLRIASVLWQNQRGAHALMVVAKATFRLLPGESRLAEEQEYPNDDDNHWNDDTARSLYSPSDMVPFKARPEVMLVGHAFAPRKEPARALHARIVIGDLDKSIEVTGDRVYSPQDGQIREVGRFLKMPLRYERAGGGPETSNPVGVRADARPDAYGGLALPNLLPAGAVLSSVNDMFTPVGFGPISPSWPSRWKKLGRHAPRFAQGPWNRGPLPEDIDPSYFNAAPEDQRLGELRDNERIVLENLHPDQPRLVTSLPGVRPAVFVELSGRPPQRVRMEADTLWIDTDRSICTVTWRGQIGVESSAPQGRVVVAMEEGQKRLAWSDIQRMEGGGSARPKDEEGTALVDLSTVDGVPSVRDSARAALAGMSSSAVKTDSATPFAPPPPLPRPPEMPQMRTAPQTHRRPVTLTDVNLSAGLPFLRSELADRAAPPPSSASDTPWSGGGARQDTGSFSYDPASARGTPASVTPAPPPPAPAPAPPPPPASSPASDSPWAGGSARDTGSFAVPIAQSPAPLPQASAPLPMSSPVAAIAPPSPIIAAATVGGALAASNAAAAAIAPPPLPAAVPAARAPRAISAREMIDLLWFDPVILPKLRENLRFKDILSESGPKPKAVSFDSDPFEDVLQDEEPEEVKARREVFGVVARGDSLDAEGVGEAMSDAVGEDGTFVPPLVLLAGELSFVFDELSQLKAMVAATSPFASSDKKLKETLDTVNEILQTPWIQGSTGVAEGLVGRIKEAFAQGNRTLPPSYLDSHTERMLLEQRAFQKRTVLGEPHLRTLLSPLGVQSAIPTYLPEALATKLPMVLRMRVRLLAEAHLPQDQYETYPASLKAVAIGRVSPLPGRR